MASIITRIVDAVRQRRQRDAEAREDARALEESRRYWSDDVALTLADLLNDTSTKASGRVQVLSLAQFRGHIGDLWEVYQSRILMIAETTIARMIGKGNTFIPQGDDAWLLLFPGIEQEEARGRADEIAARIGEKLVGAAFSPDPPPPPLTVLLDTAGVVRADGTLDGKALSAAIERAKRPAPKAPPTPPQQKAAARPASAPPKTAFEIMMRPAWSRENENIDTYALRAMGSRGEDIIGDPQSVFTVAVALELCAAAGNLLYLMDARKLRGRLVLPLPFQMFFAPAGEELRKALANIPQKLRLHHLRVDAVRMPAATAIGDVATLREALRPMVREVGLVLEEPNADNPLLALEHATFVYDVPPSQRFDDREFHEAVAGLRIATKQRVAITGLRSKSLIATAMNIGFDEVGGPGLAVDQRQLPERLLTLPKRDFISP